MATERQCFRCGRRGTRRFVLYMGGNGYVCTAAKACERRRRIWERRFNPPRRRKAATA